jgi:hypothetical protein
MSISIKQVTQGIKYEVNGLPVMIQDRYIIFHKDITEVQKEQFRNYYIKF